MPARLVQRIHFEDFGGAEFERLVFAYHVRAGWRNLSWYGQTGSDQGRDLVGEEPGLDGTYQSAVVQCVNRGQLTIEKARADIANAMAASNSLRAFKFVTRATVTPKKRTAVTELGIQAGIGIVTIWSGTEFEEHLRLIGEDLLRRFCDGEAFPDRPDDLTRFADDLVPMTDDEALAHMAAVFDRPAFRTPFQQESSLPAFQQAIEDTISALNTGIWRDREGEVIRRIPSLHHLRDPQRRDHVARAVQLVDQLRRSFVQGLRDKNIRPCGCGNPNCPIFMVDHKMVATLDEVRARALEAFGAAYEPFGVRVR